MMRQQIMMKRRRLTAPYTTIPMSTFFVNGICKAFADNTPLQRKITVIIKSSTFIGTPTHGAMVNNDITMMFKTIHRIIAFLFYLCPHTRTDKTDYYIICLYAQRIIFQTDTISRRCLSSNGNITVINFQR